MLHAQASIAIPTPARYMARLCNHFAHRVTVQREATSAKVDFPNRQQTWQSTMVVLAACIVVGGYLYGLDQAFAHLATKLVNLQK